MLKIVKVNISLNLKVDASDEDDVRERVYEKLQMLLEEEELEYTIDDEDEEESED